MGGCALGTDGAPLGNNILGQLERGMIPAEFEAGCGDLKGRTGARGVLKKEVENTFAAKQWHFFHLAVV